MQCSNPSHNPVDMILIDTNYKKDGLLGELHQCPDPTCEEQRSVRQRYSHERIGIETVRKGYSRNIPNHRLPNLNDIYRRLERLEEQGEAYHPVKRPENERLRRIEANIELLSRQIRENQTQPRESREQQKWKYNAYSLTGGVIGTGLGVIADGICSSFFFTFIGAIGGSIVGYYGACDEINRT